MKKQALSDYTLLLGAVAIYSCTAIFSKLASVHPLLSWGFIFFYGMSIGILMIYAVLWQQVLKRFELSVAYSYKPISTVLSIVWAVVLFKEHISWNMLLGAAIIVSGIWVVNTENGR